VWLIEGEVDPVPTPTPEAAPEGAEGSQLEDVLAQGADIADELVPDESPEGEEQPEEEDPRDIFINERIIEGGFGFPIVSEDMTYGSRMLAAGRFAGATKKGLYSQCQVSGEVPTLQTQVITDCVVKGRVTADGQKIYRTPACPAYKETTVITTEGGQWFCAADLAEDAGFVRASDCPDS